MQIAKTLLSKSNDDKKDLFLSILEYRNTPVDSFRSPAQLLMTRRLRSTLPTTHNQLQPETVNCSEMYQNRTSQQERQKKYYDRSAKPLTQLHVGQSVGLQEHGRWKPAVVIKPADTERSYQVRTAEEQEYRRNRKHLLDTSEISGTVTAAEMQAETLNKTDDSTPGAGSPASSYKTRFGREIKPRVVMDL